MSISMVMQKLQDVKIVLNADDLKARSGRLICVLDSL